MKRTLLVFCVALTILSGCAFLQERRLDWEACKADPACYDGAKRWQGTVETVATAAASAVPVPGAAAAPKVAGYVALGLAMLIGGHAVRKKKAPDA